MRRAVAGLMAVLASSLALAAGATTAPAAAQQAPQADLTLVSTEQVRPRLLEHTVSSAALGGNAKVRVQLPTGYDEEPGRLWPMALLLHGRSEDGTTWSERTDLEQFDHMVVVMPDGGRVGWYTDWHDDSCCAPPRQRWESFHLGELLPWIERTYRLADGRSQRFVAGDSMGGFGAMSYAARHPDLFGGAAELSGFVDLVLLQASGVIGVDAQSFQVAGVPPGSIFGPFATEEVRWRGRNPVDLAENLRHTDLVLRHGNGLPGQFGGGPDAGEAAIRLTGISLSEELTRLGIEHVWDDYGNGVHTWPYWEWGLQLTWPRWLGIAAADAPPPAAFAYRSIEPAWSAYGWDVVMERDVSEFARIDVASPTSLTVTGTGVARVRTPPAFAPGGQYVVTTSSGEVESAADQLGRLRFDVDLGPSSAFQQFSAPARASQVALGEDYFTRSQVTIALAAATSSGEHVPASHDGAAPTSAARDLPATGPGSALQVLAVLAVLTGALARAARR
jgi:S-formylglutathione hydrolase FrmB